MNSSNIPRKSMHSRLRLLVVWVLVVLPSSWLYSDQNLVEGLCHLRNTGPREWADFPEIPEDHQIKLTFDSSVNKHEVTLAVQQQDVKQRWNVSVNDVSIGRLRINENDMLVYFPIPANVLRDGKNTLHIWQTAPRDTPTDDIRVGNVQLLARELKKVLSVASCELTILDADSGEPIPARITVVNSDGALQSVGAKSNDHLAVRPGLIYTSSGFAKFGVPAGSYKVIVGRGFEYSIDQVQINVSASELCKQTLRINREVPTKGFVACDPHVHTLTHSGHGDATIEERMITLAAEGIELPVATDHNFHADHRSAAEKMNVREFFTPVIGNEVTTKVGHINIFPVQSEASTPNHNLTDWSSLLKAIYKTPNVKIAILNHARDQHSGVTPFGPKFYNAAVGENIHGWEFGFNAMEVVNSSSTQTDILRLFHDWMALLNRGYKVTPVGSSDSHDVGRHFVGQGRTYIACGDSDPGNIDVGEAVDGFLQGKVMVSYGLLTKLSVEKTASSGETTAADGDTVTLTVDVLGPHWTNASQVMLYCNGQEIARRKLVEGDSDLPRGVKAIEEFQVPKPSHDVHYVAIAIGPGIDGLFWKTAKPYNKPGFPNWTAHVIGCSGAVWLDADGDGKTTSAHEYASELHQKADGDLGSLIASLKDFDQATAAQAAHLCQQSGQSLIDAKSQAEIQNAAPQTAVGIRQYLRAWRDNQIALAQP